MEAQLDSSKVEVYEESSTQINKINKAATMPRGNKYHDTILSGDKL